MPDPRWGETAVAFVVPAPGAELDSAELIAFCSDQLARFKRPSRFVVVDALPRNAAGKVLKRALRSQAAEGPAGEARPEGPAGQEGPEMTLGTMLTPRDALLHQPAYHDPTWLETNWFSFLVPQHNLRAHMYTGFRSNLGVVFSQIHVWSRDASTVLDFDHWNSMVHLPMPPGNLDHYRLGTGIEVRMTEPLRRWTVTYDGPDDTRFELDYRALMPAVDSRETALPGGTDFSHFHAVDPALAGSVGHIDLTLAVTGEAVINGRRHTIDFPSNHDHSWTRRAGPWPRVLR